MHSPNFLFLRFFLFLAILATFTLQMFFSFDTCKTLHCILLFRRTFFMLENYIEDESDYEEDSSDIEDGVDYSDLSDDGDFDDN